MLGLLKETYALVAPVSGRVMELKEVPDEVFAAKLAGDGVAIEPNEDIIVAPTDGKIVLFFKTNHAFCIRQDNGVEIMVHVGLDTVELKGEGFERLVEEGTRVKLGEPILKVNRKSILEKGYSLITPVLVTTMDIVEDIKIIDSKEVVAGENRIFTYSRV